MGKYETIRCSGCSHAYVTESPVSVCPVCGKTNYSAAGGLIAIAIIAGIVLFALSLFGALVWAIVAKKKSLSKLHAVGAFVLGVGACFFWYDYQSSSEDSVLPMLGYLLNIVGMFLAARQLRQKSDFSMGDDDDESPFEAENEGGEHQGSQPSLDVLPTASTNEAQHQSGTVLRLLTNRDVRVYFCSTLVNEDSTLCLVEGDGQLASAQESEGATTLRALYKEGWHLSHVEKTGASAQLAAFNFLLTVKRSEGAAVKALGTLNHRKIKQKGKGLNTRASKPSESVVRHKRIAQKRSKAPLPEMPLVPESIPIVPQHAESSPIIMDHAVDEVADDLDLSGWIEPGTPSIPPPPPEDSFSSKNIEPTLVAPNKSSKGLAMFVVGVLVAGLIGMVVSWLDQQAKEQESAEIQKNLWADLKMYKTDPDENRKGMPNGSLDRARKAYELHPTPDSAALVALAAVWESGWHFGKARWKARKFERDDEFTKKALQGEARPAALLARAWLTSNACVLMTAEAESNSAQATKLCKEGKNVYKRARKALSGDKSLDWLYFESLWTEVRFMNKYIEKVLETDSPGEDLLSHTKSLCNTGREVLEAGPVNDVELALQCTKASAIRKDWSAYIAWVQTHLELASDDGNPSSRAVGSAFWSASPDCKDFQTSKRHRLKHRVPIPYNNKGEASDFCTVVGYAALGCTEFGVDVWDEQNPLSSSPYDWKGMIAAVRSASSVLLSNGVSCVYSAEVHNPYQLNGALDRIEDRMTPSESAYSRQRTGSTGSDVCSGRNSKGYPTKCVPCCEQYFGGTETCYLLCGTYY